MGTDDPGHGYVWATAAPPGTQTVWHLVGADGLDRLRGPSTVTAAPAGAFAARLVRVQLDHVAMETFTSTPHTSSRLGPELLAREDPRLSFLLLLEGRAHLQLSDATVTVDPGQSISVDSRDEVVWTTETGTRLVRVAAETTHVAPALRRPGALPSGRLPRTALADGYIAFVRSTMRSVAAGNPPGARLTAAVTDLHSAVLREGLRLRLLRSGAAGLRGRIDHFIDSRLADPDLGPVTIARAFGLSLRQAHAVFDDGERTLARVIRERRVEAVALELQAAFSPVPLADLARRHGFGSADTLARAFRRRFGLPIREYRAGGGPA